MDSISPQTIFLTIGAIGFLFVLISFLFGEIFEGLGADFHHDLSHEGPGLISARVISIFVTAFGGFGAIAVSQGFGSLASSLVGLAGGVALGAVVYYFARFLYSQQASSDITSEDLIGLTAQVIVAIPAGDAGQVRCIVGESLIDKIARSRDGSPIPHNSLVRIEEVTGESVIVTPLPAVGGERGLFSNVDNPE
jgi:membrane protein implicated in regulation of membrane protease activity